MRSIAASEAARSFMAVLKAAEDGEEVVITRAGKPIARLVKMVRADTDARPDDAPRSHMRSIGWRDHP
ncbi:MAG: type II toxin-antitoxin system prevent-host-death family antitoxin [Alphaproteobacteria bacterium]